MTNSDSTPADLATPPPRGLDPAGGRVRIDLHCVGCGYNLRGLSPVSECPECGMEVRQSILFVVDPARSHLSPLHRPHRLGRTLVLVAAVMLFAIVVLWIPHVLRMVDDLRQMNGFLVGGWPRWTAAISGVLGLLAAGALRGLARPLESGPPIEYRRGWRQARLGLVLWGGLLALLAAVDTVRPEGWMNFLDPGDDVLVRHPIRLGIGLAAVLVVAGFRPLVRLLALRSLNHRVGQISRQGFLALTAAILVVWAADLVRLLVVVFERSGWFRPHLEWVSMGAAVVTLIGFSMVSLASVNLLVDALRLARGMTRRRYELAEIVDPRSGPGGGRRAGPGAAGGGGGDRPVSGDDALLRESSLRPAK